MSDINASFNILEVQGARRLTSNSGRDIIVIDIAESRLNPHQNGKVYMGLDIKERKETDPFGNTHRVTEVRTKEERQAKVNLPIIGNGKEISYGNNAPKPAPKPAPAQRYEGRQQDDSGDDIPF